MTWRTIDSAPKDGRSILIMCNDEPGSAGGVAERCWCGNTCVAEWWESEEGEKGEWVCYMDLIEEPKPQFIPTHWMPLPEPPDAKLSGKSAVYINPEKAWYRKHYAGLALQGLCAREEIQSGALAKDAVEFAEALIAALELPPKDE